MSAGNNAENDAPRIWRCEHYSHDTARCTPTKHYGPAEPRCTRTFGCSPDYDVHSSLCPASVIPPGVDHGGRG